MEPPAVVGRRGVAVARSSGGRPGRAAPGSASTVGGGGERPPQRPTAVPRARRSAHGLTAARNTDEPNGQVARAEQALVEAAQPQQHPLEPRPDRRGRRRRPPAGVGRGDRRCCTPRSSRSAANIGKTDGEAVRRAAYLEAGRLERRDRPRAGVAAVVAVGDVVVGPRPLVRRHRHQQPAAGLEHAVRARAARRPRARSARSRRRPLTTSKLASREGQREQRSRTPRPARRGRAGRRRATPSAGRSSQPTLGPSALPTSSSRAACRRTGRARSRSISDRARYHQ